jgi:IS5 family transposase
VPWDSWITLVEPSYHSQARGRHVRGAETMLRMYLLQVMFGLLRRGNLKMLSWIPDPCSASCTWTSCLSRCQMLRHLRNSVIASSGRDSAKLVLHDLNSELEKAGITARGGPMVDATFIEALKLHKEQGPCARPLKRTSPRKGRTGVSDTRRISA